MNNNTEDAPLLNLLGRSISDMSTDELRAHVQQLREVSSNTTTLKQQLTNEKRASRPPSKAKADSAKMLNKYLNM